MIAPLLALQFLGCAAEDSDTEIELPPPEELTIPGIDGVDLEGLVVDALGIAIHADNRVVWDAHVATLGMFEGGCPDIYTGTPDLEIDGLDEDARGYSWLDNCQAGDTRFGGYEYWENRIQVTGEATDLAGRSVDATRMVFGDGVLSQGGDVIFEFDGEGNDSLSRVDDSTGFSRFTYSSFVDGTVTGSLPFPTGAETPGGYRTDMYLTYTGGDSERLEARGNVYFFEHRLAGRFDSLAMDLEIVGPLGATPDVCTLEPRGWIGVRDEDAYWYDVVFEPRSDQDATGPDYEPDPYTACDGCGTLYIRGLAQDVQVCPDLSFLWSGALVPPEGHEFALSVRSLLEDP